MLNVVAPGQIVGNDETLTSLNQIFRSSGCPDRSKASPAAASKEASGESNGNWFPSFDFIPSIRKTSFGHHFISFKCY
jgi:hypothetical protein